MTGNGGTDNPIVYVHAPFGGAHYRQSCELRERVLRKPLGIPLRDEDMADDAEEELFCALKGEHVIASLQLKPIDQTTVKLRQMAVEPEFQKSGIGSTLVRFAEDWARANGITQIVLHARVEVTRFYEALDYAVEGERFVSVGIPHVAMRKRIR